MDQNATYAQVLEALKRADSPELGQLLGFRPWQYYAIEDDPRFIRLLEQPLPKVPTATLVEALQGWRVPYSVQDGQQMETLRILMNWLPVKGKRCHIKQSSVVEGGMGLFAAEDIQKGELITKYGGFVYASEKEYVRTQNGGVPIDDASNDPRFAYFMKSLNSQGKETFLDGYRGFYLLEQGRWANTQDRLKKCNAVFAESKKALGQIYLKARRQIAKGEEIFVWYGSAYRDHLFGSVKSTGEKARKVLALALPEEEVDIEEDEVHFVQGLEWAGEVACNNGEIYQVPRKVKIFQEEIHRGKPKEHVLPALEIRQSTIPGAGCGLFAAEFIKHGTWITEYGGALIKPDVPEEKKPETHTIGAFDAAGSQLDGVVFLQAPFRLEDYIERHEVMQFANSSSQKKDETKRNLNADRRNVEILQPDLLNNGEVRGRVFLVAKKDIQPGEEIYYPYERAKHKFT